MAKNYLADLKAKRKTAMAEMTRIMGNGASSLTPSQRGRFDDLAAKTAGLDTKIAQAKNERAYGTIGKGKRNSEEDRAFTRYLRSGDNREIRADGPGLTSAPNDAGLSAGATGFDAGYMIPQGQ